MDSKKVTKNSLVDNVYMNSKYEKNEIQSVVDDFLDVLKESMKKGCTIELRGFGTFEPRLRKREKAQNPKTGEKVSIQPHYTAVFRPGQELQAALAELPVSEK